jgi:transcription-repair coupling factor (superfamily II helicase)
MRLKVELRRVRALGCEATATSATLHLRDDTPLDPEKVGRLVVGKKSPYRVTPDMRLTRRARDDERFRDGIDLVDRMLTELASCRRQENP